MNTIAKAFLVGYALELVSIASAVSVGAVPVPHLFYGSLLNVPANVAEEIYRVLHAGGICFSAICHDAWHKFHAGSDGCPDPLQLFAIIILVQGAAWSEMALMYLRHKRGKRAEQVAHANAGSASG